MAYNTTKARVYLSMVEDRVIDWKKHDEDHHGGNFDEEAYKRGEITCTLRDAEKKKENADKLDGREYPQISSEARHSTRLDFGKWLETGKTENPFTAYETQLEFQRATQGATAGLFDEIAKVFNVPGLRKVRDNNLVGYYADTYTDGLQEEIELPIVIGEDGSQQVESDARKAMNAYCAMQSLLRRQDAVTWNAPLQSSKIEEMNGFDLDFGTYVDYESYHDLVDQFNECVVSFCNKDQQKAVAGGAVGFISTRRGVRIIDFGEAFKASGYKELADVCKRICTLNGLPEPKQYRSDGEYIGTDKHPWAENDDQNNGKEFFELLKATEHENELKAIYEKYVPLVYRAEQETATKLGYSNALKKQPTWK